MKAIVVTDQAAGTAGMTLAERPKPEAWRSISSSRPTARSWERSSSESGTDARLRTNISQVTNLDDAVSAFNPTERIKGKTIIRVRP